ncbi:alanine racemase [Desulfobaculum xiamenense]|uniref:Alanine racemase n=1 Tax=Desulfobaculum xiamenense TaxID=995050 RepID=A0A846QKP0_9BACT|nr:alanine racemase [Desulfobaculum xiamenense]NJB67022.1 alanine racemase [Desulfobaculum xiamenense]
MTIAYNHLETIVYPERIAENWRRLEAIGGHACAVIKADAYGHGLLETARALDRAGAHTLGAGTVEEAARIRADGYSGRVMSLLGAQLDTDFELAARERIVPFTGRMEQLRRMDETGRRLGMRVPIALKLDTGMGRLGFVPEDAPALAEALADMSGVEVSMVCSHLATADMPEERDYVLEQGRRFANAVDVLRRAGYAFEANLANSAALLAYPELRHDAQRPGISLYGCNVFWGTDMAELGADFAPAMEVRSRVYQVHELKTGQSVNYGRTFVAPCDMRVAIIAAGYSDNFPRALSNRGFANIGGTRVPLVGRVCMQMSALDVTELPGVKPGDDVWLLGGPGAGAIRAEEVADWCGTISYEVLCLLGQNPRRFA